MTRLKAILFLLMLGGLLSGDAPARVFRAAGVHNGELNTAGLPWEFAYRTTLSVNGQRNAVQVYSARFNEPVAEQLKSQFEQQGAEVVLNRTSDSTIGLVKWAEREARILILSPATQPNQIIFLFYPEPCSAGTSSFPIPEYPGAKISNITLDQESKTFCATLETADSIEEIHTFYAATLGSKGWRSALPAATSGLAIFHKRDEMCCILAKSGERGLNRITVLVKGGGL